ncbi:NAD-dependent succinate-semialdehyde dehydrogenase [Corynebacterium auriscanis]|uniref:Succinate-semialdehyde dehydrogenase n=1 Tax=Corynebacterium auriscanis TaxID=99807 RepID=A0A0A2DQA2_9CORY|nr:NAD-dependent succinate-semialdehyde dehydrogenase [Corynebacterium auriscanis]KGM19036.1 succinate-semialdehyde dehydrogenase [Corynebacterium auriscanis]WJY72213.1 Succinate-semialdehyde dehydrogenase [NADP(+)] [Corynebacterium auriscanis]
MTDNLFTTLHVNDLTIDVPTGLLVGGQWKAGSSHESFDVLDAATGSPITSVHSATEKDAAEAMDIAVKTQEEWGNTAPRERAEILRRIFDLIMENDEKLAALQSLELGRALPDSRGEVTYGGEYFRWFSERAVSDTGEYRVAPGGRGRIVTIKQPVGPALAITPWNFPLAMIARKLAPALASGCVMIAKPAQLTPLTMLFLAQLTKEAGLPDGVFQVLPTKSAKNISVLLDDDRLRKFTFTGSTEVGQMLASKAAEKTIRTSLELGGNAPFVVLNDADVDLAVEAAVTSKMRGGGQVCIASNRFIVHEDVADRFERGVVEKLGEFVLGPGTDEKTTQGPMVSAEQRDKVAGMVEKAIEEGAKVALGGPEAAAKLTETHPDLDPNGFWYPATVLTDVEPEFEIAQREIFGPVLAVQRVSSDEEALRVANDTIWGLAGYVCGTDMKNTMRFAERMEAGMIGVNRGIISDAAAPFGGMKQSGVGREGGFEGIDEYQETKYLALDI